MKKSRLLTLAAVAALMGLGGCATSPDTPGMSPATAQAAPPRPAQTDASASKIAELENLLAQKESQLSAIQKENASLRTSAQQRTVPTNAGKNLLLPPNAKPGECYARVLIPPQYRTVKKQVMVSPESERIEITAARYETVPQKVLVKEPSEKAVLIPAKYQWVTEKIMVKEPSEKIIRKPAVYKTVSEQVLVRPAYTTWKKGTGPIQKVDNATGEIMCLVEIPAKYKTVTKRVMVKPAHTEKVKIPAQYKMVKKRVMVEPPKMVKKTIPGVYKTVMVRKMATPPQEKRIKIPAKYRTLVEQEKVRDAYLEWRPILCKTNTTPRIVTRLQKALAQRGYNPGPIDGVIGRKTMAALTAFQKDNKLASGQITLETLRALGI